MGHRADRRRRKREEAQLKKLRMEREEAVRSADRRIRYNRELLAVQNVNTALLMSMAARLAVSSAVEAKEKELQALLEK